MAHLYWDPELPVSASPGDTVRVDGAEGRHAVTVARLQLGEDILVGDGRGLTLSGTVSSLAKSEFTMTIDGRVEVARPRPTITLVQALAKGDRDERAVEQATEFGVDTIVPWEAERSISRWHGEAKANRGRERWMRIAREASKQSMRPWFPEVRERWSVQDLLDATGSHEQTRVLVLHPSGDLRLTEWLAADEIHDQVEYMVVVGPEGGLTKAELDRLSARGAEIVRLGDTVLRTSSAGPAALALLSAHVGRW